MQRAVLLMSALVVAAGCSESSSIVAANESRARFDIGVGESVTSASAAIGRVLPAAYQNTMGDVNNSFPHAAANMRYQQVFLGSELTGTDRITGLCLRHDELFGGRELTENLTVKLGPTSMDNTNLGTTFDDNYSAPPTEVFSGSVVIPATTGEGTPDMFDFCVDFSTEYLHPAGANLIVEIVNSTATTRTHPKDACSGANAGCTTRRVVAFSATASTASIADNMGLIMAFLSADPTEKVDCTEGKWADYGFRNQGQCIRFVNTEKDSRQ